MAAIVLPRPSAEFDIRDYGAACDGTTNDTAAWNAAIAAATAGGTRSGIVLVPQGVSIVNGSFVSNGVTSPIITLPPVASSAAPITLTIRGLGPAAPAQFLPGANPPPPSAGYSVLKCTRTDGTAGCSLIGGPQGSDGQNNVAVNLENLIVAAPANPTFTAIDLQAQQAGSYRGLLIYAGATVLQSVTQPTHSWAYGITTPLVNHSPYAKFDGCVVFGFYNGFLIGEDIYGSGLRAWGCVNGFVFTSAYHGNYLSDIGTYWGPYHLTYGGPNPAGQGGNGDGHSRSTVAWWDIEDANGAGQPWQDTVYHVNDPGNALRGSATALPVLGGVGYSTTITKNGGTSFKVTVAGGA